MKEDCFEVERFRLRAYFRVAWIHGCSSWLLHFDLLLLFCHTGQYVHWKDVVVALGHAKDFFDRLMLYIQLFDIVCVDALHLFHHLLIVLVVCDDVVDEILVHADDWTHFVVVLLGA